MGEYAKYNGKEIKIGTCESMYYLRYEDRFKVQNMANSINPANCLNLFWRLPYPDEDAIYPGHYEKYNRGERLYRTENGYTVDFSDKSLADDPGTIQLRHECGLLVNIKCYHGEKLPDGNAEIQAFFNGKSWFYELAFIKNTADGIYPIVKCRHCNRMWRYQWSDVMEYINDEKLKERLEKHTVKVA